jgi:hypothetical protein
MVQLEGVSMESPSDRDCAECQGENPNCVVCRGGQAEGQPQKIKTLPKQEAVTWKETGFACQQPDGSQLPLF